MTATNEMPGVIWVYNRDGKLEARDVSIVSGNDQYHHTAALIEAIEGMKERYTNESYRAALQDVIDYLKERK
jgi:hypothetical protein